ncbi:helix-turn-helix transcriptional regulator [Cohnella sp. AR92]|uniref:helix-turn-helix transcriptional regulator n=1 Tax=Cohnella sp. AR92 TaxID=648716 RepID=UPI000F8C9FEB|nr:XRE family transcriptional regulator [Cohnella sp. AR92]
MPSSLHLGESRVPELCRKRGITQAELARRLGVTRQFIYKVNQRLANFSFEQAINAAYILDCRAEDLHVIEIGTRTE